MPASYSLFRSRPSGGSAPPPDPVEGAYVPPGAVLFLYNTTPTSFFAVSDNATWYNEYTSLYPPNIKWYESINSTTNEPFNPLPSSAAPTAHAIVTCIANTDRWNKTTGICLSPNSFFYSAFNQPTTKYGNLLDIGPDVNSDADNSYSGRHGYNNGQDMTNPGRSSIDKPKSFGFATGDTPHPTTKVPKMDKAHEGHTHFVSGDTIGKQIFDLNVGYNLNLYDPLRDGVVAGAVAGKPFYYLLPGNEGDPQNITDYVTLNKSMVSVNPVIRKKNGATVGPSWFPKNILVFGLGEYTGSGQDQIGVGDWASSYYSQLDLRRSNKLSDSNIPSFIFFSKTDLGRISSNFDTVLTIESTFDGAHNHQHKTQTTAVSNKTGGQGHVFVDGVAHNHALDYYIGEPGQADPLTGFGIKSKILNAWITKSDQTPIANGVIIAASYPEQEYGEITNPKIGSGSVLPPNWHFCNGSNGTIDLRGYAPVALMKNPGTTSPSKDLHGTEYMAQNFVEFTLAEVNENVQDHTHIAMQGNVPLTVSGTGTIVDITLTHTNLDPTLNEARKHTHNISSVATFRNPADPSGVLRTSIISGNPDEGINPQKYGYNPPKAQIAFIMYNNTIA